MLFPKTVRLAGRKGEVQGCAILDAAIVFERAANFNQRCRSERHRPQKNVNVSSTGRRRVCVPFKLKRGGASLFIQLLFFNLFTIITRKALLSPSRAPSPSITPTRPRHTCALAFCLAGCCLSLTTVAGAQTSFPPIYNCLFCLIELSIQTGSLADDAELQRQ